jgi:hypothetical protein
VRGLYAQCRCGIDESVCQRQQWLYESSEPCDERLAARYAELGITTCPDCDEPTHATESDDTGRCATCAAAAGEPHAEVIS